jgi:hypothetical protein
LIQSVGCFADNSISKPFSFSPIKSSNSTSIDVCVDACYLGGFAFAALQAGNMCYCANSPQLSATPIVMPSFCDFQCAGNIKQVCGGLAYFSVYQTAGIFLFNLAASIQSITSAFTPAAAALQCRLFQLIYGVVPFVSNGTLFSNGTAAALWFDNTLNCNFRISPYTQVQCGKLSEKYSLIPFITQGSAPSYSVSAWSTSNCNAHICQYWANNYKVISQDYNVEPIPSNIIQAWDSSELKCKSMVVLNPSLKALGVSYTGREANAQCKTMAKLFSIVPFISNGTISHYSTSINLWRQLDCNMRLGSDRYSPEQCGYALENYRNISNTPYYVQEGIRGTCTASKYTCIYLAEKFSPLPFQGNGYGSMEAYHISSWLSNDCFSVSSIMWADTNTSWPIWPETDTQCNYWKESFGAVPFVTNGTLSKTDLFW